MVGSRLLSSTGEAGEWVKLPQLGDTFSEPKMGGGRDKGPFACILVGKPLALASPPVWTFCRRGSLEGAGQ
jgi:hypothetical protein